MLERNDQNALKRFIRLAGDIPFFAFYGGFLKSEWIPAFIFHKVLPDEFEAILAYLSRNRYRTLCLDEYYDYLTGRKRDSERKVILTFDDGLRNNWTVAYPLLKKWKMHAVFYVNPGIMANRECSPGPNLEDVWSRRISVDQMEGTEAESPFIGWQEAKIMQASGFTAIESHGWRHRICFVDDQIIDFQRPDRNGKPLYSWLFTAVDANFDDPLWGIPVYRYQPRLAAGRRFYDDPGLRKCCLEYVGGHGGKEFFTRRNWRKVLMGMVRDYRQRHGSCVRYESGDEQELGIRDSLMDAQNAIEKNLGKRCEHFAYPWHASGRLSLLWLRELGFKTVFRAMKSFEVVKPGCDPYNLSRIEGYWIPHLPGTGREYLWNKGVRVVGDAIRGPLSRGFRLRG
jgi:peptidoglycan/xylan/chitin deacetylase (PgdA/CDA1 family)